jgi:hypothetical protein
MSAPALLRGQCLCGAVQFTIQPPTKWCAHCHCSYCRRAHGAPFITWVGVPEEQFRLAAGEEALGRYASSPEATRSFCRQCGSPLLFVSSRWPGEVHVAAAALLDPPDRLPAAHAFFDQRVEWILVDDTLLKLGGETGTEPLPAEAPQAEGEQHG